MLLHCVLPLCWLHVSTMWRWSFVAFRIRVRSSWSIVGRVGRRGGCFSILHHCSNNDDDDHHTNKAIAIGYAFFFELLCAIL